MKFIARWCGVFISLFCIFSFEAHSQAKDVYVGKYGRKNKDGVQTIDATISLDRSYKVSFSNGCKATFFEHIKGFRADCNKVVGKDKMEYKSHLSVIRGSIPLLRWITFKSGSPVPSIASWFRAEKLD